jgi:hypothetical protein
MLTEEQLEVLTVKYQKIGVVDHCGHRLVFKRPSREVVRDYRRKLESPTEKPDALDQLAQATIVAFDDEQDPNKARVQFTQNYLEEFPMFTGTVKFLGTINVLVGVTEQEESTVLGKGCSVRSTRQASTPQA